MADSGRTRGDHGTEPGGMGLGFGTVLERLGGERSPGPEPPALASAAVPKSGYPLGLGKRIFGQPSGTPAGILDSAQISGQQDKGERGASGGIVLAEDGMEVPE